MNNKKCIKIFSIGLLAFVAIIFGTTYAFFNYTKIGGQSILSTGQIRFNTSGELLIDVERDFPQDADLSGQALTDMKNSHKGELTIQSHTTIANGVAYRIYAVRGDDITGKLRLNDENIKFQLTPNFTSGENGFTVKTNDYENPTNLDFDGEDRILLSTGIVKNTSQLTSVTYNYYMWIDGENTLISSTTKRATLAEGNPSLADTTSGNTTADRYMTNDNTLTQNVTIFPARSSDTGKTVYTTNEFSNGYYNIKIVVEAEDRVVAQSKILKTIKKDLDTETTINFANNSSSTNGEGLYILPGTENDDYPIYYYRGAVDNNNVLFAGFCWQMVRTTDTGGIKMIYNGTATGNGTTCENATHETRILASTSAFNSQYNSLSDVGYMKNARYTYSTQAPTSGAYFGTDIEYGDFDNNGTSEYRLVDDGNGGVGTTLDATHHYSCDLTSRDATCTTIRYYYYVSGTTYRYINLTGGEKVEDALYKMTGTGDASTKARNASYVLNQNDSMIKTAIENWFKTNLTNEEDSTKRNYASYLEDTVFCNDRSFKTLEGNTNDPTYAQSGWNPDGGNLRKDLIFGTNDRSYNNWYSTSNVPTVKNIGSTPNIACPNESDRFSVNSSVAHLNYPVGLLTIDEIVMAGASGNNGNTNNTYYLYTGDDYWSMSPNYFYYNSAQEGNVDAYGYQDRDNVSYSYGVRPVVSLKLGTEFENGGDGTGTNPYVVKY